MKKGDFIIIAVALVLATLPLLMLLEPKNAPAQAVVRQNGQVLYALPLGADAQVAVDGAGHNIIAVENGEVFMLEADCPDGTCLRMGRISRTGETLVCLPHRLTITITGTEHDLDAITQ